MLWIIAILQCDTLLYGLWIQATQCSALRLFMFFIMHTGVHGAFKSTKTEGALKKVNDGFVHCPASSHNLNAVFLAVRTPSSPDNHSPALTRHLTPTLAFYFFSKFLSHCHFPFYLYFIPPLSWSLYHCHSNANLPAIAASPGITFLTANLCSGRTHPSSGSLRCAPPFPAAPQCTPVRRIHNSGPSVTPSEPF